MPIEIQILSGSRQGEQLRLDIKDIGVGDSADCQVRFSSESQPAMRGRRAALRLNQEGWQLRNQGTGEWFVNHFPVPPQGTSPLRSGDIVRLSAAGPDFMFSVVSSRQPVSSPLANAARGPSAASVVPPNSPETAVNGSMGEPTSEEPSSLDNPETSASNTNVPGSINVLMPYLAAGGVALLVTLIGLVLPLIPSCDQPPASQSQPDPGHAPAPNTTQVVPSKSVNLSDGQ